MKQEQLQAIRERCEKATPGPWFVAEEGFGKKSCPTVYAAGKELRYISFCDDKFNFEQMTDNLANAKFIAHAREDVPALLAEVERLQEAIKHLKKLLHPFATKAVSNALYMYYKGGHFEDDEFDDLDKALDMVDEARKALNAEKL